jgi:hypothetical protein
MSLELSHSRPLGVTVKTIGLDDTVWFFVRRGKKLFEAEIPQQEILEQVISYLRGERTGEMIQVGKMDGPTNRQYPIMLTASDFESLAIYVLTNTNLLPGDNRITYLEKIRNMEVAPEDQRSTFSQFIKGLGFGPGWSLGEKTDRVRLVPSEVAK